MINPSCVNINDIFLWKITAFFKLIRRVALFYIFIISLIHCLIEESLISCIKPNLCEGLAGLSTIGATVNTMKKANEGLWKVFCPQELPQSVLGTSRRPQTHFTDTVLWYFLLPFTVPSIVSYLWLIIICA